MEATQFLSALALHLRHSLSSWIFGSGVVQFPCTSRYLCTAVGIALSETLHLHGLSKPNFLVGCSVLSSHQPAGIAGFGRGLSSLPSQLGLGKFSYCLLSRRFDDDTKKSSSLVLDIERLDYGKKTNALVYTPFVKNPKVEDKSSFSVYYYLGLRRITIGADTM
ncbi:hypothetical protein OIU84_007950 [Salix udensis]|uniref:Xylanase inhibitor N-terminal domain-containing protein n=1 Tax=Salix udensis TaxID=889485 RepID=A0AAD6JU75_9ROSI|nr:hypothetical protein OIU84_007950 [Salix udensis]